VDLRLEFGQTYLAGLSGKLLDGIAELIWNAIDAEAHTVAVELGESNGAVVEVRVVDDGHGIDFDSAQREFGVFGDSWKAGSARSKTGMRSLHGRAGRGRLSIFKHGGTAVWRTVSELSGSREALTVTVAHDAMDRARLSEPTVTTASPGTTVTLSGFSTPPAGIQGNQAYERLLTTFAIAARVEDVAITYAGRRLDVADALLDEEDIPVQAGSDVAVLTLLEWNRKIKPAGELHLCDEQGVSRYALPSDTDDHGIPFTAYLRWSRTAEFHQQLSAAGLDQGALGEIVREATSLLQRALDRRRDRRRRDIIETWIRDGDYPFDGEPAGDGERVTRETFELVAVEAATVINSSKPRARRLSLRLLKEALERNPDQIHHILDQVLDLDQESVDRLSRLLSHTPLSRVIAASAAVAERLEFLGAITDLTTDRVHRKRLLERSQLHKLVAAEPWIFGEEYALAASDRGLTEVLRQNLTLLGRSELAEQVDEEVLDADGNRAIVDLLFSGVVLGADDQQTMLVVELKRPSVAIGDDELAQLRKYVLAVHEHDRFDLSRTRFDFWAVSTTVSKSVKYQRKNSGPDLGQVEMFPDLPIRVWVKTWAEILHTARHRLRYVQQQLDYAPSEEQSFDYLRRTYADRLPPTVPRDDARGAAA
jgi:hypothetical protein